MSNVRKVFSVIMVSLLVVALLPGCPKSAEETLSIPQDAAEVVVNGEPAIGQLSVGESVWYKFATKKDKTYVPVFANDFNNGATEEIYMVTRNDKDKEVLELISLGTKLLSEVDGEYYVRYTNNTSNEDQVEINYAFGVNGEISADADVTTELPVAANKEASDYQPVFVAKGQVAFLKNKGLIEDESSLRGGAGASVAGGSPNSKTITPRRLLGPSR